MADHLHVGGGRKYIRLDGNEESAVLDRTMRACPVRGVQQSFCFGHRPSPPRKAFALLFMQSLVQSRPSSCSSLAQGIAC